MSRTASTTCQAMETSCTDCFATRTGVWYTGLIIIIIIIPSSVLYLCESFTYTAEIDASLQQ